MSEMEALKQQVAELQAKLEQASQPRSITYKVSEKGALSAYGIHSRFPVTMYANQWARLDSPAEVERRKAFIKANQAKLATK